MHWKPSLGQVSSKTKNAKSEIDFFRSSFNEERTEKWERKIVTQKSGD